MKNNNLISISEYAKRCGVTRGAIQKAIKSGRINKGYDVKRRKIIEDEANREYGFNIIIKKTNEKLKDFVSQDRLDDLSNIPVSDIQLNSHDTESDARRKATIISAQRDLLKLKCESGELVNKEAVYKELFNFGKEVRVSLQKIPDRIIDQLITLERNEAHKMLIKNINEVIEKLSNTD